VPIIEGMRLVLVIALAAVAAACQHSPAAPTAPLDQDIILAPGQRVEVDDSVVLEFQAVVGDSRCPGDALCITGGDATVRLEARRTTGERPQLLDLHTGDLAPVRYLTYTVALVELAPYPFSSLPPIAPGDYRVTVRVSR
jgi:hypothetical protein